MDRALVFGCPRFVFGARHHAGNLDTHRSADPLLLVAFAAPSQEVLVAWLRASSVVVSPVNFQKLRGKRLSGEQHQLRRYVATLTECVRLWMAFQASTCTVHVERGLLVETGSVSQYEVLVEYSLLLGFPMKHPWRTCSSLDRFCF